MSVGYNGFPQFVNDDPARYANRDLKYKMVVHAERNAILFSDRNLADCTLYTHPFEPCPVCAGMVIQSQIRRVVSPPLPEHLRERWASEVEISRLMFAEASVQLDHVADMEVKPVSDEKTSPIWLSVVWIASNPHVLDAEPECNMVFAGTEEEAKQKAIDTHLKNFPSRIREKLRQYAKVSIRPMTESTTLSELRRPAHWTPKTPEV